MANAAQSVACKCLQAASHSWSILSMFSRILQSGNQDTRQQAKHITDTNALPMVRSQNYNFSILNFSLPQMASICPDDDQFGPIASLQCRLTFDFTLKFEEIIFGIVPQCLLICVIIFGGWVLATSEKKSKVNWSRTRKVLSAAKALCCLTYVALNVLVLVSTAVHFARNLEVAVSCLELVSSILISVMLFKHTAQIERPSHIAQFSLLAMIICFSVRARTLFLVGVPKMLSVSFCVRIGFAAATLVLESLPGMMIRKPLSERSPDEHMGLFSLWFLLPINELFWTGTIRCSIPVILTRPGYSTDLTPEQLPCVDEDRSAKNLWEAFKLAWPLSSKKSSKYALHLTIYRVLRTEMIAPIFPRLLEIAATLAQPFLILGLLNYLQDPHASPSTGYALLLGFAFSSTFSALFNTWFAQLDNYFDVRLRTGIISLIYETCFAKSDADVGRVIALINVDMQKLMTALKSFHNIWSSILTAVVGCYILYLQIGLVFLITVGIMAIFAGSSTFLGKGIASLTMEVNKASARRITALSEIPTSMKSIRMLGLEKVIENKQTLLRRNEVMKNRQASCS
jgi:ATP-binding cassette, subfamily C (CFTR/MRP), member 1